MKLVQLWGSTGTGVSSAASKSVCLWACPVMVSICTTKHGQIKYWHTVEPYIIYLRHFVLFFSNPQLFVSAVSQNVRNSGCSQRCKTPWTTWWTISCRTNSSWPASHPTPPVLLLYPLPPLPHLRARVLRWDPRPPRCLYHSLLPLQLHLPRRLKAPLQSPLLHRSAPAQVLTKP